VRRYPEVMPRHPDDHVARGSEGSGVRTLLLTAGVVLAVVATLAAFVTDDPRYLRLSVVAAAWAFVAAAFAATRRRGEQQAAAARESELRRAYERELDLEAAARREFELELENDLRAETDEVVRREVSALRGDIAALARVRGEMARVAGYADDLAGLSALRAEVAALSGLRTDVAALASLRAEVAGLSALRGDVAALASLRADLGQLAELRADVARLRQEVAEQLNGEMLVERIVMRTQATRMPAEPAQGDPAASSGLAGASLPPLGAVPSWSDEPPPRELTGGWPAIRLDEPRPTREFEHVRAERPRFSAPLSEPRTATFAFLPPSPEPAPPAPSPLEWLADRSLLDPAELPPGARSRHAAAEPGLFDAPPPAHATAEPEPPAVELPLRPVPYRRRRTDDTDELGRPEPADDVTAERPLAPPDPAPQTDGQTRLAEILAESGVRPSGRRQHRYREDDGPDDVLARVLRQN
jgi:hypothetical protein